MTRLNVDDTIAAIASASGPGYRGILRLSGPGVRNCLESCLELQTPLEKLSRGQIAFGQIRLDPQLKIDCEVLWWPDRRSYTRQPAAEIHLLGNPCLLTLALEQLCQQGARLAEPGEFTLRAFLSGRLDLTQAEAVLAVIDARQQDELDLALNQLAGGLAGPLQSARNQLIELLAELEAGLDFVEEDIEFISRDQLLERLEDCRIHLVQILKQVQSRSVAETEILVALSGWPNVGKSSLFNQLCQADAIVADQSGTTRDFISGTVQKGNQMLRLIDTAGFEITDSDDAISDQAQQLTAEQVSRADIRVLCLDRTRQLNSWEQAQLHNPSSCQVVVLTKCDQPAILRLPPDVQGIETSGVSGAGIGGLATRLFELAADARHCDTVVVTATAVRASDCLRQALDSVLHALDATRNVLGDELVASELRTALDQLGRVVGAIYTDDILDIVFGRFCIGK